MAGQALAAVIVLLVLLAGVGAWAAAGYRKCTDASSCTVWPFTHCSSSGRCSPFGSTGASGAACSASAPCATGVCNPATGRCVPCIADSDCKAPTPACDAATNQCVECTASNSSACVGGSTCVSGACSCPAGSYYVSQTPAVMAMFGAQLPAAGCYGPSTPPAQAVTTDCYPAADSDAWASWGGFNPADPSSGASQACACEFGPAATWAGHLAQAEGTEWCSEHGTSDEQHTNPYICSVPYPTQPAGGAPPANPFDGAYTATNRWGFGQAGAESNSNPGLDGAYDYSIWDNDWGDAPNNRCQDPSSGGPYAPGWGWYAPTSAYWTAGSGTAPATPGALFPPTQSS